MRAVTAPAGLLPPDCIRISPGVPLSPRLSLILAAILSASSGPATAQHTFRVCADPNNLPFSNRRLEGFENRIAAVLARELDEDVRYFWWPQRRGFIRHTLDEGRCDVVMGVPAGFERVLTTAPYYRSTYVFVSHRGATRVRSFDDPALGRLRIGVQFTGDGGNPPPAQALARRGLAGNIVSFSVDGDYRQHDPPARLIEAVARRRIDLAVAWGPLAGYFATRVGAPLDVVPVPANEGGPGAPMSFAIAVGVRRADTVRRERLQRALERRAGEIHRILLRYGVPLVDSAVGASR